MDTKTPLNHTLTLRMANTYSYFCLLLVNVICAASAMGQVCNGLQDLGTLGGNFSAASGVSSDGTVIVGSARNAAGQLRAFRWTEEGGMQDLGTLAGAESQAFGVSADGSVVVGVSSLGTFGGSTAFRWTLTNGMEEIGPMPAGSSRAVATDVSSDGNVAVGSYSVGGDQLHAFRWSLLGGIEDLGTFGAPDTQAAAVSGDGNTAVGTSSFFGEGDYRAFRWRAGTLQDLVDLSP